MTLPQYDDSAADSASEPGPAENDPFLSQESVEDHPGDGIASVDPGEGVRGSDSLFGLLLAGAVAVGLAPLINSNAFDMRYTLSWGVLAGFGVLAWLFGGMLRIAREKIENAAWGIVFGLILAIPLLGFGGSTLNEGLRLLFTNPETELVLSDGTLLAYLVFVMPLGETLFFRGVLQEGRTFWAAGLLTTLWQLTLFFPLMNRGPYPLIIGTVLLMANAMYSYARARNGLAAAWLCQITVNLVLIFFPIATA